MTDGIYFPLRAILVEKDASTRLLLNKLLHKNQYQVYEADNYEDAVRAYISLRPSLMILNQYLDGFTGLELAEFIRCLHDGVGVKIIMQTNELLEIVRSNKNFGCLDYCVQQGDFEKLNSIIESYGEEKIVV